MYEKTTEHAGSMFALPERVLLPIIERIAGQAIKTFEISIEPEMQGSRGWNALIVIPTVYYVTRDGGQGAAHVCVKRFLRSDRRESAYYNWLHEQQFPVPMLYGTYLTENHEEILFIEYLTRVGSVDSDDPLALHTIFSLRAQLYGLPVQQTIREQIQLNAQGNGESFERLLDGTVASNLERMWTAARQGVVGQALQALCSSSDGERLLPWLLTRLPLLVDAIQQMPHGLVNDEMGFGYRAGTDEVAAFDWHGLHIGSRCSGVAQHLGTPDGVRNGWGRVFRPREEYAAYYAEELTRWCGVQVTAQDVLAESFILWQATQLLHQGWWLDRSINGDTVITTVAGEEQPVPESEKEATRQGCRLDLYSIFRYFLQLLQQGVAAEDIAWR